MVLFLRKFIEASASFLKHHWPLVLAVVAVLSAGLAIYIFWDIIVWFFSAVVTFYLGIIGLLFFAFVAYAVLRFVFFVLAAIPYALKILVVGLFVADKDRFTARAKNAFNLIALAVLIGSEYGLVSALVPLTLSMTLDPKTIYGIGAVFVFVAYAYYMRLSFQEGVKAHLSASSEEDEKAKQKIKFARNLTLPSSFFLNLMMDVIMPTLLLILVLQQGYCAAFVVTGDLVSGSVENLQAAFQDTLMTDLAEVIWQQILSPVYQAVAPQAKSILATVWPFVLDFWNGVVGIVTELRANSPFWEKVFDAVSSINLRLMNLPDCNPPALPLATVP